MMKPLSALAISVTAALGTLLMLPPTASASVDILIIGQARFRYANDGKPSLFISGIGPSIVLETNDQYRYPLGKDTPVGTVTERKMTVEEHKYWVSFCENMVIKDNIDIKCY